MRTLKVAWDNNLARRDHAGTGIYATRLLDRFATTGGIETKILYGWQYDFRAAGFVGRAVGTAADMLWTHVRLPLQLRKLKPDLLHSPAFVAPAVAPCPVVVTVHDVTYLLYPSHFSRWWRTYLKILMPRVINYATAVITVSQHSKNDIVRAYGVSKEKVHVVPNGVDHQRFSPTAALDHNWAASLGLRSNYLLHVGTLAYRKNIPTLLRAVAHLRKSGKLKSRQLVLAGSESRGIRGAEEIYQTIQELDLTDTVVLAGHVPDNCLGGLYAAAEILVMPSLYEGFGFPVLEAMASGTPVVSSNTSSLPEVGGSAALYFPPEDHYALSQNLEAVLTNGSLAADMRSKGLKRAAEFSWERTATETIRVYRGVVKGR